ncbi:MAG: divalent-cation tolerance protein CutA [Epsilonproteobacteria bacterium]|nr:divalent-cation tolerance protein CutA [Campylobacterota bacterium]
MYIMVITTTSTKESAKSIAKSLLQKKLAACVQIDKIKSLYLWKGEMVEDKEYRVVIKSKKRLFKKIKKTLLSIHPYETPQIIAVDIDKGNREYFNWIDEVIKE